MNLNLSVLGYRDEESGDWLAHCLEMDIVGHGKSFEAALQRAHELVEMQISYAVSQGHPHTLWNPAPPKYWMAFNTERERMFFNYPSGTPEPAPEYIPTYLEAPHPSAFDLTLA